MEERIKKLSKELTGSVKEKAEKIRQILLWDLNSHIPLQFIIENMEK